MDLGPVSVNVRVCGRVYVCVLLCCPHSTHFDIVCVCVCVCVCVPRCLRQAEGWWLRIEAPARSPGLCLAYRGLVGTRDG